MSDTSTFMHAPEGSMTHTAGGRRRRWLMAAVAGVTPAALVLGGIEVADAATPPPALGLVAAAKSVTAQRWAEGGRGTVVLDLGVNIVAGGTPLEIHATRKSYADPIVAD